MIKTTKITPHQDENSENDFLLFLKFLEKWSSFSESKDKND